MRFVPPRPSFPQASVQNRPYAPKPFETRWPIEEPLPESLRQRICCIIPCYDVGPLCESVVRECANHVGRVIAVDDGSTDETPRSLAQAVRESPGNVSVITLARNRGKGVALTCAAVRFFFQEQTSISRLTL